MVIMVSIPADRLDNPKESNRYKQVIPVIPIYREEFIFRLLDLSFVLSRRASVTARRFSEPQLTGDDPDTFKRPCEAFG